MAGQRLGQAEIKEEEEKRPRDQRVSEKRERGGKRVERVKIDREKSPRSRTGG
jgi:hypothetical protein